MNKVWALETRVRYEGLQRFQLFASKELCEAAKEKTESELRQGYFRKLMQSKFVDRKVMRTSGAGRRCEVGVGDDFWFVCSREFADRWEAWWQFLTKDATAESPEFVSLFSDPANHPHEEHYAVCEHHISS